MNSEVDFLSEKELRLLTAVLMRDAEIKKLWWKWRKDEKTNASAIVSAFDGGYIRVQPPEVRDLLYKLSDLAGVADDVKDKTTEIFDELKVKDERRIGAPRL